MNHVSVIIPTFNSSKTVLRTLESVKNQTKSPYEVIVSDNGSSDNTLEIVRHFHRANGSMNIFTTSCNEPGSGPNRNHAVDVSTGNVLAFLDADDRWDDKFLEKMTGDRILAGCIKGAYARYVTETGVTVGQSIRSKDDTDARDGMLNEGLMPCLLSSWVMNRNTFTELDGFDANYVVAQDFELMYRHLRSGGYLEVTREVLLSYLIHAESETTTFHLRQRLTAIYILKQEKNDRLNLEEFLMKNISKASYKRQSKSDGLIRAYVTNLSQARLKSYLYLLSAFILSPIRFTQKSIRQRPTKGS